MSRMYYYRGPVTFRPEPRGSGSAHAVIRLRGRPPKTRMGHEQRDTTQATSASDALTTLPPRPWTVHATVPRRTPIPVLNSTDTRAPGPAMVPRWARRHPRLLRWCCSVFAWKAAPSLAQIPLRLNTLSRAVPGERSEEIPTWRPLAAVRGQTHCELRTLHRLGGNRLTREQGAREPNQILPG